MGYDRRSLKLRAREKMRETEPRPLLVVLVFVLIVWIITALSDRIYGKALTVDYELLARTGSYYDAVEYDPAGISVFGWVLQVAFQIVSILLGMGLTSYCLHVARGVASGFQDLLDGCTFALKVLWLWLLRMIYVFLWTLLFVVPGIIAIYKYRQAYYLLLDHPEWRASDCLRQSKLMMRGHKWELFVLDLSFLGWFLLCVFPPVTVFLTPYRELSYALYYDMLAGAPAGETPPRSDAGEKPPWEY